MNRTASIAIPVDDGHLAAVVHFPSHEPAAVVVCSHGMLSSKDGRKFVMLGEELSRFGMVVVRFDFSGCGASRAPLGDSLLAGRKRDLEAVIDYVKDQPWGRGPLGLLGSSLGGYISLVAAASSGARIRAVVCWATPFDLTRIRKAMEEPGALPVSFPPGFQLGSPQDLTMLSPIPNALVIHGKEDELVPWMDATEIYRRLGEPKRLFLMETADHRILDPAWRRLAVRLSREWFLERALLSGR